MPDIDPLQSSPQENDRIHLTVATIIERDNRFLLVREWDNGVEVINQPAGHVEPGETLQQAALRETREETGWEVTLMGLLGFTHYLSPRNGKTYYRFAFTAEAVREIPGAVLDKDIIEPCWLTLEELEKRDDWRSPMVIFDIKKYIRKEIYPIEFIENMEP